MPGLFYSLSSLFLFLLSCPFSALEEQPFSAGSCWLDRRARHPASGKRGPGRVSTLMASPWQQLCDNSDGTGKSSLFPPAARGTHDTSSGQEVTQLSGTSGPVFWMLSSASSNYGIS